MRNTHHRISILVEIFIVFSILMACLDYLGFFEFLTNYFALTQKPSFIEAFGLIGVIIFLLYLTSLIIQKVKANFDEHHSLIIASLLTIITLVSSFALFVIGNNTQHQFWIHLLLVMTILSFLAFIIDYLMIIKKQNSFVNYKIIKNTKLFNYLTYIYSSFNIISEKKISKIEKDLLEKKLERVIGQIKTLSKGKYELDYAEFPSFWTSLINELEKDKNLQVYYTITDFTQIGNLKEDRLSELMDNANNPGILKESIQVRKLFIHNESISFDKECRICDSTNNCTVHSTGEACMQAKVIAVWSEIAKDKSKNIEVKCFNKQDIMDKLKGKNIDIGIFGNMAMGFQLSTDLKDNQTNDILKYIIHFDEIYIQESIDSFNDLWLKAKTQNIS